MLVCVGGLGMLVGSDLITDKNFPAISKGKGDAFMIIGATLYGICMQLLLFRNYFTAYKICVAANATEEFFVRRSPLYEVLFSHFLHWYPVSYLLLKRSLGSSACGEL